MDERPWIFENGSYFQPMTINNILHIHLQQWRGGGGANEKNHNAAGF